MWLCLPHEVPTATLSSDVRRLSKDSQIPKWLNRQEICQAKHSTPNTQPFWREISFPPHPPPLMDNAGYYLSHIGFDHKKDPAKLIVLSHRLNLPMSMPLAIKYAGLSLRWLHSCDEELLTTFLPLVENENAVLRSMVSTLMGRKCKGMTPEDIHNVTKEKDFANKCV